MTLICAIKEKLRAYNGGTGEGELDLEREMRESIFNKVHNGYRLSTNFIFLKHETNMYVLFQKFGTQIVKQLFFSFFK